MFSRYLPSKVNGLTLQLSQSIVIRYHPKRSMFDKTSYNPEWVPRVNPYSKHRKPRMSIWSDPDKIVPYQIPPLRKIKSPKNYMKNVIEVYEKNKALRTK